MHTFKMAAVRPRGVGPTVLIVPLMIAAIFAAELRAQCLPPLANYSLRLEVSPNPVESCPGNTFKVAVFAEVTPGTVEISGFGLNLKFITDVPVTVISVNPRAIGPPGGFFGSNVVGQEIAIIGGDLQGRSFKTPLVLAELLVEVGIVSAPTTWTIDFTGTASLRGSFVPLNHLVEGSTGCDVLPPLLGLRKGTVNVKTCSENFIRGDCNNNGRIRGLLGDLATRTTMTPSTSPMRCT